MKALLLFVLAFAAFLVVRFVMKRVEEIRQDSFSAEAKQDENQPAEIMITCAECGVHLPKSEAIPLNPSSTDKLFCSQVHKQAYLAKHPEEDA